MSKFSLPVVQTGLRNVLDEQSAQKVLLELKRLSHEEEAGKEEKPKPEKKVLSVIRPDDTTEIAWVIAHPENMHPQVVHAKILEAAAAFNASKRGRFQPVQSLGEALEQVSAKFFKEVGLSIRTKLPVTVLAVGRGIDLPSLAKVA